MKKLFLFLVSISFLFVACSQDDSILTSQDNISSDQAAITQLIGEDEAIQSFEPNYNEEDIMDYFGKVAQTVYPVRVGQKMRLTDKNIDVQVDGDSAFVSVTDSFEGILFIAASYDEFNPGDPNVVDTLLQKSFTSQVKRNIIMIKVANTDRPLLNWRVKSISLPEGGTLENDVFTSKIQINKMIITFQNGDTMEITDPNNYFLSRMPGFNNQVPVFGRGEEITVNIELQSAYADTDFVSVTWGGIRGIGNYRAKRKLELVSSEFDGTNYQKIYQQTFTTNFVPGFRHAVINAMPKQVVYDDSTPVEQNSWGMPYAVR